VDPVLPRGDEDAPDDGDGGIPQDMPGLLAETADLEPPVEVADGPEGVTYGLAGRPFAWAGGLAFEAQLGPDIAAAALRTPDVLPSSRGSGWIRLQPLRIDDHAADRVVAWFEMARRIAAGRQVRPDGGRRH
jgi:hypothetical protein